MNTVPNFICCCLSNQLLEAHGYVNNTLYGHSSILLYNTAAHGPMSTTPYMDTVQFSTTVFDH